jgi:hypothetical protein
MPNERARQAGIGAQRMAAPARLEPTNTMSRPVDELIQTILDDFAAGKLPAEVLEAKALFLLLNYCPPPPLGVSAAYPPSKGDPSTG